MTTLLAAPLDQPPLVRMPYRQRLHHVRNYHTGSVAFREAAGPVCRVKVVPSAVMPPFGIVASPQGIHDVLAAGAAGIDKDTIFHKQTWLWGMNVFNMLHEEWKPRRRLLQPVFTRKHVETFTGHMARAAAEVADEWAAAGRVQLNPASRSLTLRVLGRSLFGVELQEDAELLEGAVQGQLRYISGRGTAPVRAPVWLPTPARARFRADLGVIRGLAERGLAAADAGAPAELVQLLRAARDPATGKALSRDEIVDELVVFLLAGHDTTATTLAYTLWQLGRHPDLQERVADEVGAVDVRELNERTMGRLPETMKVLHESLRLCPPGAVVGRFASRDIDVDGFRMVAGTAMFVSIFAVQRDRELWGPDAEEFRPDRFDEPQGAHHNRWAYLPFGGGPRSCIGDHFAMTEAVIALAALVQRLRFTSLEPDFPLDIPFTMTAGGPIPAEVAPR